MMMPKPWGIVVYILFFAWVAFNWFHLRPRIIKKDRAKIDEMISHYDSIGEQFETE